MMTQIFHALSESHLISRHGIQNSMIELYIMYGMVDVNASADITCALRWGVASIESFSTRRGSPYMG